MTLVVDKFRSLLPPRTKSSPSGWTSFNAPCCHHRGHSQDKRKRAGVRFDNGIVYHCFNCKFITGWQPGSPFGEKMKSLCRWLGASEDNIKELVFESLKTEAADVSSYVAETKIEFEERSLPDGALPLTQWVTHPEYNEVEKDLLPVIEYIYDRGFDPFEDDFLWSPAAGYSDRVIIPFYWKNKIVGSTGRKIGNGKPKYISDQQPHFVFNFDSQVEGQTYVFVVEGIFDAISINGVGVLSNDISDQQARIINSLGAEVIVIPDQDLAGTNLIKRAMELNWSVAFPNWDPDVKDCADAVKKYGKLYTIIDAIKTKQQGDIKITMSMKQFEKKLKLLYNTI